MLLQKQLHLNKENRLQDVILKVHDDGKVYSYAHADQPLLNEVRLSFRLSSRPQL